MTWVDSISLQSHVEQSVNFLPHILLFLHDKCLDFLITHSYIIIGHGRYIVQHTLSPSEYQIASVFIWERQKQRKKERKKKEETTNILLLAEKEVFKEVRMFVFCSSFIAFFSSF